MLIQNNGECDKMNGMKDLTTKQRDDIIERHRFLTGQEFEDYLKAHTEPEDERKFATMEEVFPEFTAEDERYVPCPICGTHVCKSGICPQSDPHPKHANQIALQKYREYTGLHNVISPFEKWLQEDK